MSKQEPTPDLWDPSRQTSLCQMKMGRCCRLEAFCSQVDVAIKTTMLRHSERRLLARQSTNGLLQDVSWLIFQVVALHVRQAFSLPLGKFHVL